MQTRRDGVQKHSNFKFTNQSASNDYGPHTAALPHQLLRMTTVCVRSIYCNTPSPSSSRTASSTSGIVREAAKLAPVLRMAYGNESVANSSNYIKATGLSANVAVVPVSSAPALCADPPLHSQASGSPPPAAGPDLCPWLSGPWLSGPCRWCLYAGQSLPSA